MSLETLNQKLWPLVASKYPKQKDSLAPMLKVVKSSEERFTLLRMLYEFGMGDPVGFVSRMQEHQSWAYHSQIKWQTSAIEFYQEAFARIAA